MAKVKFKELPEAFTNYFDLSSNVHGYNTRHAKPFQEVITFQDLTNLNVKDQLQLLARNYGINYHKKYETN